MTRIVHCATTIVAERLRVICANAKPVQRLYYGCSASRKFRFPTLKTHFSRKFKCVKNYTSENEVSVVPLVSPSTTALAVTTQPALT